MSERFVLVNATPNRRALTVFKVCERQDDTYHVLASSEFIAESAEHAAHRLIEFCEKFQCPPLIEDDFVGRAVRQWLFRLSWEFKPRPANEYLNRCPE